MMQPDPNISGGGNNRQPAGVPPPLPTPENPKLAPPPLIAPLLPMPRLWVRPFLAILLSVSLGLFLADGIVSLLDDSLVLALGNHTLTGLRGTTSFFALAIGMLVYGAIGLTPAIPKRVFLPLTLFGPAALLGLAGISIYFYRLLPWITWTLSLLQVLFGLGALYWVQGGLRVRWPLVREQALNTRQFGWTNLAGFVLVNFFVLLPAVALYLVACACLAVSHFSDGFVALRREGLTVQERKYARQDGRTIRLAPMAHIGEPEFYRKLSQSFPSNSVILMEGVTDEQSLLTNRFTYKRTANSLGLAEQQKEFKPRSGEWVRADVDVSDFQTNTIDFLNLVSLVHARGISTQTLLPMLEYSPPPHFEERLFEDLLQKRNRRVLEEIQTRLVDSQTIIVPWGAAHMPGIAKGIQAMGFRMVESRERVVISFRRSPNDKGH